MISDVLSDAIQEIERYQREMPHAYGDPELTRKIEAIKKTMRELMCELITPPGEQEIAGEIRIRFLSPPITAEDRAALKEALTDIARSLAGYLGELMSTPLRELDEFSECEEWEIEEFEELLAHVPGNFEVVSVVTDDD